MKQQLLELLHDLDKEKQYFGIIPLYPVYEKAKDFLHISIADFHKLLLDLEKTRDIYLEPINDYNRLKYEEKKTAIYDEIRGYLYYIGFWK